VAHGGKSGEKPFRDTGRRGIGIRELGMGALELFQLTHQRVVLPIGDLRLA
jgi:hypothetical protein